jgi:hypothetical protein
MFSQIGISIPTPTSYFLYLSLYIAFFGKIHHVEDVVTTESTVPADDLQIILVYLYVVDGGVLTVVTISSLF